MYHRLARAHGAAFLQLHLACSLVRAAAQPCSLHS